jgi:hypothetical protein
MLSLVRSDVTGEMELRGSRAQLEALAVRLRGGGSGSVPLERVADPSPYDRSLSRVVIHEGTGRVDVSLMSDGQSLLIRGGGEFLEVLAANIEVFAQQAGRGEHLPVEYFPDHYYLAEEAQSLVVAFSLPGGGWLSPGSPAGAGYR